MELNHKKNITVEISLSDIPLLYFTFTLFTYIAAS